MTKYVLRGAALCAAVVFTFAVPAVPAVAAPAPHVDRIEQVDDRNSDMYVYSPSMGRNIPLQVIEPADTSVPRPTLYLLNGAGGGEDGANWLNQTKILDFLADKNVNVVIPAEGMFTYYTDWIEEDPVVGVAKWQTFLTEELPPVIDDALGATGVNAIAGLSMAATSVLSLAIHAPDLYRGVASYSGCAQTSDPLGQAYLRSVIEGMGETDATNMWARTTVTAGWRTTLRSTPKACAVSRCTSRTEQVCPGRTRIRHFRGRRRHRRCSTRLSWAASSKPLPTSAPPTPGAVGGTRHTRDVPLPGRGHPFVGLLGGRASAFLAAAR